MPKATKRERQRQNRDARRQAMLEAERRQKRFKLIRTMVIAVALVGAVLVITQVTGGDDEQASSESTVDRSFDAAPSQTIDPAATYTATISTNKGDMTLTLDAAKYPIAVNNFVFLANKKFYDDLKVVRVVKDFVFQAGSPDNSTQGGPGYSTQAEVPVRTEGTPLYPKGTLAMAKTSADPAGTIGSQFFIVTSDTADTLLGTDYAIVGRVTGGLDVVDAIGKLYPAIDDGPATETVRIERIRITKA